MRTQNLSRENYLKLLLEPARPQIEDLGDTIVIAIHKYRAQILEMIRFMETEGFKLISVFHVEHDMCSGSGREFWWVKDKH